MYRKEQLNETQTQPTLSSVDLMMAYLHAVYRGQFQKNSNCLNAQLYKAGTKKSLLHFVCGKVIPLVYKHTMYECIQNVYATTFI